MLLRIRPALPLLSKVEMPAAAEFATCAERGRALTRIRGERDRVRSYRKWPGCQEGEEKRKPEVDRLTHGGSGQSPEVEETLGAGGHGLLVQTFGPAALIEDGSRGEVQLGPAEQPRGHEQRRAADAEAGADQRVEQGSAGARDAHRHAFPAVRA